MVKVERYIVQIITGIMTNSYLSGFANGVIYKGDTKKLCVPGLNCYSCPGAIGACPIGALQAVIGGIRFSFSFYVAGILGLFGILFGRLICGWICPFGFIQELLYKIPFRKVVIKEQLHKYLKYSKDVVLLIFVIVLPLVATDEIGMSPPYFCEYICPAGTLEGGVPLLLLNERLRGVAGSLFAWKLSILLLTIGAAIAIFRPFCKYLCPLGAIYSWFNKFSFYQIRVDGEKCTSCTACAKVCKMNVKVYQESNHAECIRCGDCIRACAAGAITAGYENKTEKLPVIHSSPGFKQ